jgi:hypothetical protein
MNKSSPTRLIQDPMSLTLRELVVTVRELSRNDVEATRVINHLLLTRRARFLEPLDQEEVRLLHS